jgi:hypothetical protein
MAGEPDGGRWQELLFHAPQGISSPLYPGVEFWDTALAGLLVRLGV